MKIAIPELNGEVNQHFGRSTSFAIAEINNSQLVNIEVLSATGLQHNHVGVAELLKENGVSVVIAGGVGAGMVSALQGSGFEVLRGATGNIKQVAEIYARGEFVSSGDICNHDHDHHHQH